MTTHINRGAPKKYNRDENNSKDTPQVQMDNMVKTYWANQPYIKDLKKNHELEVRFGTRGIKPLTKIDFDNVIRQLKSLGFTCPNEQGAYMLRIHNEFLDSATGRFKMSNIRTEIRGFHGIQEYCKHNDIKKLMSNFDAVFAVEFYKKLPYLKENGESVFPVNFDDFNFRVSYQTEERIKTQSGIIQGLIDGWEKSKKTFRYINRVTFSHPDIPINVDISIVKSSSAEDRRVKPAYTTEDSGVFRNPEVYEIELEVNNSEMGPGTNVDTPELLLASIRKAIKYVLMGLQGTNFPISYVEQNQTLQNYMKLTRGDDYNPEKRIYPSDFMGPSSYTLQIQNVVPINENMNVPNIRNDYTVTDKADGDRHMMYISATGKIYLINTNMKVLFTGAKTENKEVFNSLIDGEIIYHDKYGKFINLYAAFDVYIINGKDVRSLGFISKTKENVAVVKCRLPLLKNLVKVLKPMSVVKDDAVCPIRIESKKFYPTNPAVDNIFGACRYILEKDKQGLFEYNTDGLIFTPASMGVGADKIGKAGPVTKSTWDYSFKWKPAHFNTIDFLVTTKKAESGIDVITPIFQEGTNASSTSQIDEYKTIILRCGFDERKHGYLNPCQDVINDVLPSVKNMDNDDTYKPVQFYPTNPYDVSAGIGNIMLKKDDTGSAQMYTEENEVFGDNTIVEFRYEIANNKQWRWVPLRVRYDKTAELRQGLKNFGNAYHVANSNWHSIHNPITEEMITTGNNIPDEIADDDVYYNRIVSASKTRALRDFHNLYVKKMLIDCVSKKGDNLIDFACGKGGDFPKWISSQLSFVFGIDVAKDNLENKLDGACARFLNYRKKFHSMPYALFVNGNSGANIRSGSAMLNDRAVQITKAVFGSGPKDDDKIGKGVARQYGKGEDGFNISSCQFALHYFFENQVTFQSFIRNVAECTKLGGYFIGTSYDGKLIFNLLKNKKMGESVDLYEGDTKIWEIQKDYDDNTIEDDVTSLGYTINVFQESINKMFSEYLVNFDYLDRVMENYGFKLITRDEAKLLGLPEGSGLFSELYNYMLTEVKRNKYKSNDYGTALEMTAYEKKISFLNRYFVYKKISHVNAEKIALESIDETLTEKRKTNKAPAALKSTVKKSLEKPKKARKLNKKILLVASHTDDNMDEKEEEKKEKEEEKKEKEEEKKEKEEEKKEKEEERKEKVEEKKEKEEERKEKVEESIVIKPKKPRAKKVKLIIEE